MTSALGLPKIEGIQITPFVPKRFGVLRHVGNPKAEHIPTPELVRETIPLVGTGFLGGQSGAFKSFAAIELCVCVNTGHPFAGRTIEATGATLYIAFEGAGTITGRLKARLSLLPEQREPLPFFILEGAGPVTKSSDLEQLGQQIMADLETIRAQSGKPVRLIVVDTVTASGMIGEDKENDPAAWQKVFDFFNPISKKIAAPIVLVHHYGKDANAGLRGSSNARAGADFALAMTCKRDEITGNSSNHFLALTKSRDWPEGSIAAVSATEVQIANRADGTPISSLVLSFDTGTKLFTPRKRPNRAAQAFSEAFRAAMAGHSERVKVHGEAEAPTVNAVRIEQVRQEFTRIYVTGQTDEKKRTDTLRKQFANALKSPPPGVATGAWGGTEWAWNVADNLIGMAE
jgi:hypothetical protein